MIQFMVAMYGQMLCLYIGRVHVYTIEHNYSYVLLGLPH